MEILIVSSIILLAVLALAFRLSQRKPLPVQTTHLPQGRALFDIEETAASFAHAEAQRLAQESRAALLTRAAAGDTSVLQQAAASGEAALYRAALEALTAHANNDDEALQKLVNCIAQDNQLRAAPALATALIARWQTAPEKRALGEMLHIAALSDDAATFQQAVTAALQAWRAGQLTWASASNLKALLESEYWILAPEARRTGAGFLLKRMLVEVRRELAAAPQRTLSSS